MDLIVYMKNTKKVPTKLHRGENVKCQVRMVFFFFIFVDELVFSGSIMYSDVYLFLIFFIFLANMQKSAEKV